jgi:predicted PurR-regulated permease PerM
MEPITTSPRWTSTTKLVIGITLVAVFAFALAKFQGILPPLIMTFILVYLLYPVVSFFKTKIHLSWNLAVILVYASLIVLFLALVTISGFELVSQVQSLILLVETSLTELPDITARISSLTFQLGPLEFDMSALDLNNLSSQLIETARMMLGQTGEFLGTIASTALNSLGWTAFVMLMSFFILAESRGLPDGILKIDAYGYANDWERMKVELANIWNAFLRGQLILVVSAIFLYTVVLSLLGVRYALGLALLTGAARFLPYVGPAMAWVVMALVAFFQNYKLFGLSPLLYTLLVLVIAWVIDSIFDNIISPRIMADALKVHPAAVLVAAIIALDLLGLLGVVIAAPMLATLQLMARYMMRKLFDLDPWIGFQETSPAMPIRQQLFELWEKIKVWFKLQKKA